MNASPPEIAAPDSDEYANDDAYLRSIEGMETSILAARKEPIENSVPFEDLAW